MDELQVVISENRKRFVAFLTKRLGGDGVEAEELFQSAIARSLEKGIPAEDEESAVAWFYRVLRNALVDGFGLEERSRSGNGRTCSEFCGCSAVPWTMRTLTDGQRFLESEIFSPGHGPKAFERYLVRA